DQCARVTIPRTASAACSRAARRERSERRARQRAKEEADGVSRIAFERASESTRSGHGGGDVVAGADAAEAEPRELGDPGREPVRIDAFAAAARAAERACHSLHRA